MVIDIRLDARSDKTASRLRTSTGHRTLREHRRHLGDSDGSRVESLIFLACR